MNFRNQRRFNGHKKTRNGQEERRLTEEDINVNVINKQQVSTILNEDSPGISVNNAQHVQMIRVNGKLYVPVQQEHFVQANKINNHVHHETRPTNIMNHQMNINSNHSNYVEENTLVTPDSYYHLQEKPVSTPKRSNDQLNRSNEKSTT